MRMLALTFGCLALSTSLFAQAKPARPAPTAKVATINGKPLTVGGLRELLRNAPQNALQGLRENPKDMLTNYTLTDADLAGPFVPLPSDMMEKAKLPALGYTSVQEALGEKFHMSPTLLKKLNPKASFAAGEQIQYLSFKFVGGMQRWVARTHANVETCDPRTARQVEVVRGFFRSSSRIVECHVGDAGCDQAANGDVDPVRVAGRHTSGLTRAAGAGAG